MAIPGIAAIMAGSTSISAIMHGAQPVWTAGGDGPPPIPLVTRPEPYASWVNPAVPAWAAPAGWSSPDPHWPDVVGLFDMGRLGMDQSEHAHPADWRSDAIPSPDASGIATLLATGGLVTAVASPVWSNPALTVEVFDLTPAEGAIIAAEAATVQWSLGWTGTGWEVVIGAMTQIIPDAAATWPAHVALVVSAGVAALYRGGALIGTVPGVTMPTLSTRLGIGGTAAHSMSMVRITAAARYSGSYTPEVPASPGAARLGGARVIGYGAWTWYNDARAIGATGKVLFGSTTKIGMASAYDPATGGTQVSRIATWAEIDDHNNPAFVTRQDGQQLAICTGHAANIFYKAISSTPGRVDDLTWAEFGGQMARSKYSYSNIHQLEGLPGEPIYQIGRAEPWQIYLARSDDGGVTWVPVGNIFEGSGDRPYLKTIKTGPARIDIITTDGHPRTAWGGQRLWHLYFDGSVFRDARGVAISTPGVWPVDITLATELWSVASDELNSWTGALDLIGRRLVAWVFAYTPAGERGTVGHYLRYVLDLDESPTRWRGEYVCEAGPGLYSGEQHYLGGICCHPRDADRAYASINHSGRDFQLVELQRGEGVGWSVTRQITDTPSGVRNFRPYAVCDPDMLLWVAGRYASYANYTCGIAALPL